jgi:hypothetical protein
MLRKTLLLGAVASVVMLTQPAYAGSSGTGPGHSADVADAMRSTAAAFATNPIERCQNISGSQWWFVDPNCQAAAEYAAEENAPPRRR